MKVERSKTTYLSTYIESHFLILQKKKKKSFIFMALCNCHSKLYKCE